uniref:Phosphoglycerate mutase n=1 Tax=Peronospora matthiolae TaxID=2874970 RepID=A0AAV1UJA4_9STRA
MGDVAPKTLYCIRHGESTYNEWRKTSLWNFSWMWVRDPMIIDAPLSAKGKKQALELHEWIAAKQLEEKIQLIITSPLTRAIETTIGAFPDTKIPIIVEPSCREMLDTACDIGRVPTDLAQQFLLRGDIDFSLLDPFWWLEMGKFPRTGEGEALPANIVAPKTADEVRLLRETDEELDARIREFVAKLLERPEQHIAIVGHSSYFKRMLAMNRKLNNCELHETSFGDIQLRYAQK